MHSNCPNPKDLARNLCYRLYKAQIHFLLNKDCYWGYPYTFWEFWHVGESVSPEIYDKTVDLFLGLLGITGSLKISETIMDGVKGSFQYKYGNPDNIEVDPNEPSLGVDDRGGE